MLFLQMAHSPFIEEWCEHRIMKNQQIKSTAYGGKSYLK